MPMPALLQSTCTSPASSAARVNASRSVTSSSIVRTPGSCSRAEPMWSRRISAITTSMPASTNAVAIPSPIPLAPPVTKAVLPSTSTSVARPGRERLGLPRAAALLDRKPAGRHGLVGKRGEHLVEDGAQLVAVLRVGEDVKPVLPDRVQDLAPDLVRMHAQLVQAGEDAHELRVRRSHVGRQLRGAGLIALVDLALDEAGADHRHADPMR